MMGTTAVTWMTRTVMLAVAVMLATAAQAQAQTIGRARVIRRVPVVEAPRTDGFVLGTIEPGVELNVVAVRDRWLQVETPAGFDRPRGWIQRSAVQLLTALPGPGGSSPVRGRQLIRVFGTAAPTFFSAKDSTDTILGSSTGFLVGGGAQMVWPNGAFVLGNYEQMTKTGTRVLVSGTQVFTLPIDNIVTVTPISVTVGYRDFKTRAFSTYVGVGGGWYRLREKSTGADSTTRSHVSAQLLVGVERALGRWLAVAGETQFTTAPGILGDTGLSAAEGEDNLGGVTLRLKVIIGR